MKKSIRFYYLKIATFLLTTIGLLVGFSTKIIAQYGAPVVKFFMKGKVFAQNTNKPIPQVYVAQHFGDEAYTDVNGNYFLTVYSDFGAETNFFVEDQDGTLNGEFSPKIMSFNSPSKGDTLNVDIYLNERASIQDIVKSNNLPTEFNGKQIIYKKVIYFSNQTNDLTITSLNDNSYEAALFFNDEMILKSQFSKTKINQTVELITTINTLFVYNELETETRQTINLYHNYFDKEITLYQTKEKIEAIILIFVEEEQGQE